MLAELRLALVDNKIKSILIKPERVTDTNGLHRKFLYFLIGILQHHTISVKILCCQLLVFLLVVRADTDTNLPLSKIRQIDRRVGWNLLMYSHLPIALHPQLDSL